MAVLTRRRGGKTTFYVKFNWQGKPVWERAGHDERQARRLNAKRLREVREGTYEPKGETRATSVWQYMSAWLNKRDNRTVENDRALLRHHVERLSWFVAMPLADVRPKTMIKVVEELKRSPKLDGSGPISGKSVSYIYGVLRTMLRDARIAELLSEDPCVLPRGILSRKTTTPRKPYEMADVHAIMTTPSLPVDAVMWAGLALRTGMREGEVCGRRWRDLDRGTRPLWCLTVDSQYDGEPLKTDRPRVVPIHPSLQWELEFWHRAGFELVHKRKPTPDDFIVPHRDREGREAHTKSSAYKMWRRLLATAGVANRSLHSTRHTFISLCRRGGARKDVLERITHNAAGDIVDGYTLWDWQPLCEAVMCFGKGQDHGGDGRVLLLREGAEAEGRSDPLPRLSASNSPSLPRVEASQEGAGRNADSGRSVGRTVEPSFLPIPSHPAQCESGHVASHAVTELANTRLQRLDSKQGDTVDSSAFRAALREEVDLGLAQVAREDAKAAARIIAGLPWYAEPPEDLVGAVLVSNQEEPYEFTIDPVKYDRVQRTIQRVLAEPTWAAHLPAGITPEEVDADLKARVR